jgi:hypothetical protein
VTRLIILVLFVRDAYSQAPTAREVLNKMADVYSQCMTYRDTGEVKQRTGRTVSFSTAFQRPALFKFEYFSSMGLVFLQHTDHFVLWRTAPGDVQMWWTVKPQVDTKPMNQAIASATGVSATSSHNIPGLLMPEEVTGFSLASDWTDTAPVIEEFVDGHVCYKISGHYPTAPNEVLTIWVDKESLLIRKLANNREVITYSPEINAPIDFSAFQFEPNRTQ